MFYNFVKNKKNNTIRLGTIKTFKIFKYPLFQKKNVRITFCNCSSTEQ